MKRRNGRDHPGHRVHGFDTVQPAFPSCVLGHDQATILGDAVQRIGHVAEELADLGAGFIGSALLGSSFIRKEKASHTEAP